MIPTVECGMVCGVAARPTPARLAVTMNGVLTRSGTSDAETSVTLTSLAMPPATVTVPE